MDDESVVCIHTLKSVVLVVLLNLNHGAEGSVHEDVGGTFRRTDADMVCATCVHPPGKVFPQVQNQVVAMLQFGALLGCQSLFAARLSSDYDERLCHHGYSDRKA